MRRLLAFVAIIIGWVLLAVTAVGAFLHFFTSRGTYAIYATALVPLTIVTGVAAFVLFLVLRRWVALALTVVAITVLCFTQGPLWVSQTAPAGDRFTVVTANLQFGGGNVDDVAAAAADADLVSLQEVTPEALDRVRASALAGRLRYEYAIPGPQAAGTVLLSSRPLTDEQRIPNMVLNNLSARTPVPGAPSTRVLAVHTPAPLSGHAGDWVQDMGLLKDQLQALPDGPVIVAGDVNATWDHVQYRDLLTDGFADTTSQAGAGWRPTFPTDRFGDRPLAAIDHVIVRGFIATSVRTFSVSGSDHRGVVVTLVAS